VGSPLWGSGSGIVWPPDWRRRRDSTSVRVETIATIA
jgi:hypothetical protein